MFVVCALSVPFQWFAPGRRPSPHTRQISFVLLISRQGKLRLAKWYATYNLKERQKLVKEVSVLVLARKTRACNFIEYKGRPVAGGCADGALDMKIVYKR